MVEPPERTPVLVVGGALTGLSSAVFLGVHGIRCTLVERHPDLLIHPRLRGLSPRAVEAYRQIGLEPAIRQASFAGGEGYTWVAVRADTLAGEHVMAEEADDSEQARGASPTWFAPIDQDKLEVLLRRRAAELGADVRFATELTSWEQDDDGVTAVLGGQAGPGCWTATRPNGTVGLLTMQQALARFGARMAPEGAEGRRCWTTRPSRSATSTAPGRSWALPTMARRRSVPRSCAASPAPARRTWRSPWPATATSIPPSTCTATASSCSPAPTAASGPRPPTPSGSGAGSR